MGQHTWFYKEKKIYDEIDSLYEELDTLTDEELGSEKHLSLIQDIDLLEDINKAEYHDLFRTNKRNPDRSYIEEIITSRQQCMEWIENPENHVSFSCTIFDTEEQINEYRVRSMKRLDEFWDKYPNGVIDFG